MKEYEEKNYKGISIKEAVLPKNMDQNDILAIYKDFFNRINTMNNELVIMDPYLFPENRSDITEYTDFLKKVLNSAKAEKYIIITRTVNPNNICKATIESEFSNLIIHETNEYHDRIWISDRKKGFFTGTSINGIGKKLALINFIKSEDVEFIIEILQGAELL